MPERIHQKPSLRCRQYSCLILAATCLTSLVGGCQHAPTEERPSVSQQDTTAQQLQQSNQKSVTLTEQWDEIHKSNEEEAKYEKQQREQARVKEESRQEELKKEWEEKESNLRADCESKVGKYWKPKNYGGESYSYDYGDCEDKT